MHISKVTSKGQTTIPVDVRNLLDIKNGDSLAYEEAEGYVKIKKIDPIDIELHKAMQATLSDEWNSKEDNEAFNDL